MTNLKKSVEEERLLKKNLYIATRHIQQQKREYGSLTTRDKGLPAPNSCFTDINQTETTEKRITRHQVKKIRKSHEDRQKTDDTLMSISPKNNIDGVNQPYGGEINFFIANNRKYPAKNEFAGTLVGNSPIITAKHNTTNNTINLNNSNNITGNNTTIN